ncbi:MAG: hypothetical protein H7343_16545 [Undibacterium sp.]|nr:hypothetical protein [Opitutaceae bacterium]
MPDVEAVAAGRERVERREAVGGGFHEERSFKHDDVGGHPVVDVAAEGDNPRLVKGEDLADTRAVERNVEFLGFGDRVNLMFDGVLVWKGDAGADDERGDVGFKFLVALRDGEGFGRGVDGRRGVERDE